MSSLTGLTGSATQLPQRRVPRAAAPERGVFRRRFAALSMGVAAVVLLVATPAPVRAQSATTADPAAQRDQAEQRKQQIAGALDTLKASDVELQGELSKLEARVAEQERATDRARRDRDAAAVEAARLAKDVETAEHRADEWRALAAQRAVATYMRPDRETASAMLAAQDPQELGRMHVLVSEVGHYDADVMTRRAEAEQALRATRDEASAARDRAAATAQEADADLAELTALRDRRTAVHAELQKRMGDLRSEAEALNAQEARLTAMIQRQAAAASSTTTSTTTSTAAPTTVATTAARTPGNPAGPPVPSTAPGPPATTPAPTTRPPTTPAPRGRISLAWPVAGTVTSPFGPRWGTFHRGIDIAAGEGTPIRAAAAGVVFFAGQMDGYGNVILIDHGSGVVTLYAHQSQLIAGQGQRVAQGQTIGLVGSTGHSTGPHCHFEVRVDGVAVDPMGYL